MIARTMIRVLRTVVGIAGLGLSLAGCLSTKSYVDPALPVLGRAQMPAVQQPQPVTVLFEFDTKGNANARATNALRGRVVEVVAESGMFGAVSSTAGQETGGILKVNINNVEPDDQHAAAKGVGTGLTFGLAGSVVTDAYICTVAYSIGGKTTETTVRHAIHTTIGNHSAPAGMTAMQTADAVNQVVDQLVWNGLKDLHEKHAFAAR